MCTVHSFPHNIDHCLTWARSEFEGLLEKAPAEANAYLVRRGQGADAAGAGGWAVSGGCRRAGWETGWPAATCRAPGG
jgi:hypothetical protein